MTVSMETVRMAGEILTKKEPIRTLGFTLPYNKKRYKLISKERNK